MCFFDQKVFKCRDWKWGTRREACSKVPQAGDSCGIMLIMSSQPTNELCSICQKIETKRRRIHKLEARIGEWSCEPKRWSALIEVAKRDIHSFTIDIRKLDMKRAIRKNRLTNTRHTADSYVVPVPFILGFHGRRATGKK